MLHPASVRFLNEGCADVDLADERFLAKFSKYTDWLTDPGSDDFRLEKGGDGSRGPAVTFEAEALAGL